MCIRDRVYKLLIFSDRHRYISIHVRNNLDVLPKIAAQFYRANFVFNVREPSRNMTLIGQVDVRCPCFGRPVCLRRKKNKNPFSVSVPLLLKKLPIAPKLTFLLFGVNFIFDEYKQARL